MANTSLAFDADYYLVQRPDVAEYAAKNGLNAADVALWHFNTYGWQEGANPNASFDVNFYRSQYNDVAVANINPFEHFLNFGAAEGRNPNAVFQAQKVGANFDTETYLDANPDVAEAVSAGLMTAYQHYVLYGQFESRPGAQLTDGSPITGGGQPTNPEGLTFTLADVTPSLTKTFLWDGVDMTAVADLMQYAADYQVYLNDLIGGSESPVAGFNAGGLFDIEWLKTMNDWIAHYPTLVDEQVILHAPILTPTANKLGTLTDADGTALKGTIELGFATNYNDTIIAGTPYTLQGAYIDGGAGYNTLIVDMKGPFAQPKQLFNIQEVQVNNLTNYYNPGFFDWNNADRTNTDLAGWSTLLGNLVNSGDSVLDLSRATDLEKVVVTEQGSNGQLVVLGLQNYATARFEGNFDQDVTLHYGVGQGDVLNVEMANVTSTGDVKIAHNVGAVELKSEGRSNILENVDFGSHFQSLKVTGTAVLSIEQPLKFAWGEAHIDASENTGGLRIQVSGFLGDNDNVLKGLDQVEIKGSQTDDTIEVKGTNEGVVLDIDTGTGRDTLILNGVDAGRGSVITGNVSEEGVKNLVVRVLGDGAASTNLTYTDISGVAKFVLEDNYSKATLIVSAEQIKAFGIDLFEAAHRDQDVRLKIVITEDTNLSDLVALSDLGSNIKLEFDIALGATLTLTAEELHSYVAYKGIQLGPNDSHGKVEITDAGLNFNPYVPTDVGAPETPYGIGGTIEDNWGDRNNVTVIRSLDGYDRPSADDHADTLTLDTTDTGGLEIEANALGAADDFTVRTDKLVIQGTDDITFNAPVDFYTQGFTVDFSGLTGALNGLTIRNFEEVKAVIGNGSANARVDVSLTGDVGSADQGLVSAGVKTYVVTELNGQDRTFWTCDTTQDVATLGLRGNQDRILTFDNVQWAVDFLLEGDGAATWEGQPKANGNPNASDIGTLVVKYFEPGADAVVNINNQGVALSDTGTSEGSPRPLVAEGIEMTNAKSLVINVADGNAIIESLIGDANLKDVTLTSGNAVTLHLNTGDDAFTSLDATDVAGEMTLLIQDDLNFTDTELSGIDAVVLQNGVVLTLTAPQLTDIGAANLTVEHEGDVVTLNIGNLSSEEFSVPSLGEGVIMGTVTIAELPEVTLNPLTDLTGVGEVIIPADTILTMSAEQFLQLRAFNDGTGVVSGEGTINITGLTQAVLDELNVLLENRNDFNLDEFLVGNVKAGTITAAEDLKFAADAVLGDRFTFDLDGHVATLTTSEQADKLQVTNGSLVFDFVYVDTIILPLGAVDDPANYVPGMNLSHYIDISNVTAYAALVELTPGNNIEAIFAGLPGSVENIVTIVPTPIELIDRDRFVVVEAETTVASDMAFANVIEDANVQNVDLTLSGESVIVGDVNLPLGVDGGLGNLQTLTIHSKGTAANVMDGVAGGIDGTSDENQLLNVKIDATAALSMGEVVFTSDSAKDSAATATLTVTGTAAVTLDVLNTTDADVTTLAIVNNGGTLTVTGASPALQVNNTDTVKLSGSGDMVFGSTTVNAAGAVTDIDAGVLGADLKLIDASGLTGDLDLGTIVDLGANFTFISGTGVTALKLGSDAGYADDADANGLILNLGDDWTFDLSDAKAGSALTLTDGAMYGAGELHIDTGNNAKIIIDGNVDLRSLTKLTFSDDVEIELAAGASLQMTDDQYDDFVAAGGTITGLGTTFLLANGEFVSADLTDFRGITELQIEDTLSLDGNLVLTPEQALVAQQVEVTRVEGVITDVVNATWDDPDVTGAENPRAAGDFRGLVVPVMVEVEDSTVDVSSLEGVAQFINSTEQTFALTMSPAVVTEATGSNEVTLTLITTGVANGTVLTYSLVSEQGTIDASDFIDAPTGTFTVQNNAATATLKLKADLTREDTEVFSVSLNNGLAVKATPVTVIDTSVPVVDDKAPVFQSASVNGATLIMQYADDSPLNAQNTAPVTAFTVTTGGVANTVTAVAVDAIAKTVTLTLTTPAVAGQVVTVAYTDPTTENDANAIQDAAGNDAVSFSATGVINNTPAGPNTAPEIVSTDVAFAEENQAFAALVVADDVDGDALTYSIVGGEDEGLFSIDAATGELSFIDVPDFEAPADANADNEYLVTVAASDGLAMDTQDLTVVVLDVDPENTAPEFISDEFIEVDENTTAVTMVKAIDADGDTVSYAIVGGDDADLFSIDEATGELSFIDAPDFEAPADANADNDYLVTVEAFDGTEAVMQDLTVTVGDVDEVVNTAPEFVSDEFIDVDENTTAVTMVKAIDADGDTVSYAIVGGDDADLFSIDEATGELSFIDAPDFEAPADADGDNTYVVTVEASDGINDPVTQDLTVTVLDVDESGPTIEPVTGANDPTSPFDALEAGDVQFDFSAGNYTYNIAGFAAGDVLNLPDAFFDTATVTNLSGTDGLLTVQGDDGNSNVITVELTGVAPESDGAIFSVGSFNNTFTGGLI